MRTIIQENRLRALGFEAPEGPVITNGTDMILRYFVHQEKPWLGIEERYFRKSGSHPDTESDGVVVVAVNYGTHQYDIIRSMKDIEVFLIKQGDTPCHYRQYAGGVDKHNQQNKN